MTEEARDTEQKKYTTDHSTAIKELRTRRAQSFKLIRGTVSKQVKDDPLELFFGRIIMYMMMTAILGAFVDGIYQQGLEAAFSGLLIGAFAGFIIYNLQPIWLWLWKLGSTQKLPSPDFFKNLFIGQKILCLLIISWTIVFGFNHLYPVSNLSQTKTIEYQTLRPTLDMFKTVESGDTYATHTKVVPLTRSELMPIQNDWLWLLLWLTVAYGLSEGVKHLIELQERLIMNKKDTNGEEVAGTEETENQNTNPIPFSLWLGVSSGDLEALSHGTSLAPNQNIALSLADASQNILVLGGIGSGKTIRAMHPLLIQLLDQNCGGLIFDIKGDFKQAVLTFSQHTHRDVTVIGPGEQALNLLKGLTPESASSFLKSTFLLNGKSHSDAFWVDTATELCRNTLGVLSFLPEHYTLQGLYNYLFNIKHRVVIDNQIETLLPILDEKSAKRLAAYWHYQTNIFDNFDEKVKGGVHATVAQVLSPFNHPELVEAFCTPSNVNMTDVLNGTVYLVSLPLSIWGLGAKVAYTLIKLRFYNVMQQRTMHPDWNQDRPVFFMCDEFQEIVTANKDGLSDLNFWDKSRSSKTIGIVSAQALSSFYATLGDHDITHALLQNFRQKLCFRTEDTATLNYFNHVLDKVEVIRKTMSHTAGHQKTPGSFLSSTSSSTTETETIVDKTVLSAQVFRKLSPDYAVALLSVNGYSMDDVIWMASIFV